jgi:hypothetical protein
MVQFNLVQLQKYFRSLNYIKSVFYVILKLDILV